MGRLFTFGCSYTNYHWQTWADIVGTQFDTFQNWGRAGAGNFFISSSVYECHSINKINQNDVVLIMFSSIDRFDYINKNSLFVTQGGIYSENHPFYGEFLLNEWSEEHGLFNTWFSILSVKTLLDSIGCKYVFMKSFNFDVIDCNDPYKTNIENFNRVDNCLKELNQIIVGETFSIFHRNLNQHYYFDDLPNKIEGHPTIKVHLEWVKKILPEFYNENMDTICEQWEKSIPNRLCDIYKTKSKSRNFSDFTTKLK